MTALILIEPAKPEDAHELAVLVGELLGEIMQATGLAAFNFDLAGTTARLKDWLEEGKYFVLAARDARGSNIGFAALAESHALYAEGAFGTLTELYVKPSFRSQGTGSRLLAAADELARARGWKRLEVTTPPLPQFDKTLAFYQREGFTIAGGRKLKRAL